MPQVNRVQNVLVLLVTTLVLASCTSVRQHVRQYDYRTLRRAQARAKAVASPVADILDMPTWTSDYDAAVAFAGVNGQRTVVFFYEPNHAASEKAKTVVVRTVGTRSDLQKVALPLPSKKAIAARLGVERAPAIVVLDASGRVLTREVGNLDKATVAGALAR